MIFSRLWLRYFIFTFVLCFNTQVVRAAEDVMGSDRHDRSALSVNRIEWLHKTCVEDIKSSNEDNEKFTVTKCGAYIQGFYNSEYVTKSFLLEEFSRALKGVPNAGEIFRKIRQTPFCVKNGNSPIKTAKLLIDYIEKKRGEQLSLTVLTLALANEYPCKSSDHKE